MEKHKLDDKYYNKEFSPEALILNDMLNIALKEYHKSFDNFIKKNVLKRPFCNVRKFIYKEYKKWLGIEK